MRVNAVFVATLAAMTIIGLGSKTAFADTTNNSGNKSQPQQQTQYVTVQEGDYLSGIAASYQTDYVRLFDANSQIVDPDLIYPGEVLRIPSASEQLPSRPLPTPTAPADNSVVTDNSTQSAPVAQPSVTTAPAISDGSVWDSLAQCESGGNWSIDTGNGFYGGLQFTLSSWQAVGGSGYPNETSRDEQIMRAEILQSKQGWGAWPVCSAKLGL